MSRARGSPTHPALAPWAPFCAAAEDSLRVDAAGVAVAELPYPYVRGVVATRPLKRGARVLSVPLPALLTAAAADEPDAAPFFAALGRPVLDGLAGEPEDATLALLLLLHRHALGERSRWAPFLRALPAEYDLPWAWRDAEVDALGGCNLHPVAVAMTAQARHDHALLAPAVAAAAAAVGAGGGPGGPAGDGDAAGDGARGARLPFALEDYVWALSTVWSRGVSLRLSARARAPVVKVLAPFFDMFNHAPASATQHAFDATRGALTVVLGAPAAPGEQLFLCYGPYTSMENVKLRGFAVPRGPHEWFQLQVLLTPREDVAARLALVRLAPPAGDFRAPSEHGVVRASYDTSSAPPALRDVQGFFELHEGAEPLALLRFARIVLAEPGDELAALGAVMREQAPDAFDDLHLEARVVQALAGAVVELLKNLQPAEGEAAAVGEWLADADAGDAAMRELTASIQRALGYEEGAGGGGGRASAEAGAGDDGAEGLASIRAPARARGGKGGKAAAAAAPAAAVATASAATASAATTAAADAAAPPPAAAPTPAASAAGAYEAGTAPAPAAAAAPAPAAAPAAAPAFSRARVDAGVRRFQLASHLRATERRVLEWHLRALEAHSAQLKEIAAAHNEANAAARGDAGGGDTAGAGEPAATES